METSKDLLVQEAWKWIQKNEYVMRDSENEGYQRARTDSQYAFLTNEQSAEYVLRERPCELVMIKAGFLRRSIGFAVPNHSPLRDEINKHILQLESSGERRRMYDEWWGEDKCASGADAIRASAVLIAFLLYSFLC